MSYRNLICFFLLFMAVPAWADTKIMLPDSKKFADGEKNYFVQTTMPGDFESLDSIVLALLTLSPQAPNKNLTSPFFPETIASVSAEKKEPLYYSFRGLRKKGKIVILRFTGDAMTYLNSAISLQDFIKGALEETIKLHTPGKTVQYEVDGQIVEDWDA